MSYATPNVGSANTWDYYGGSTTANQVASDYTFPGSGTYALVSIGLRISGVNGKSGSYRSCIWSSGRTLLGYSALDRPGSTTAGSSPYFDYRDTNIDYGPTGLSIEGVLVTAGTSYNIGFWRQNSTGYYTAWAWDTSQSSTSVIYDSSVSSPTNFSISQTVDSSATICLHTGYIAPPGTPSGFSATIKNGGANLTWTAPASYVHADGYTYNGAGGGTNSTYYVQQSVSPYTTWTNSTVTVTGVTASVTGLTNGTSYKFRVAASNEQARLSGERKWLTSSSAYTPYTNPGVPTGLTISSPSANNASLYWTAPASTGGGTLTYTVKYTTDSTFATGVQTLSSQALATVGSPLIIGNLNGGATYYFRVTAVNTGSLESTTNASGSVVIVAPVSEALIKFNSFSTVVLGWNFTGYSPATYRIYYKLSSSPTWITAATGVTSAEYRICGLNSDFLNNSYDFKVEAWSSAPALLATTPTKTVTIGSPPSTPTISSISYNTANYSYSSTSNDIVVIPVTMTLSELNTNVIYGHQLSLDDGLTWNEIEQTTFPVKINQMIVTSKDATTWYVDLRFTGKNLPSYTTIGLRGFCDDTTLKFSGFNTPIGTERTCIKTMVGSDTNLRFEILKSAVSGITATTYTDGVHFTAYIIPYPSRLVTFDVNGLKPSIVYPIKVRSIGFTTKSASSNAQNFKVSPTGLVYMYDPLAGSSSGGWLPQLLRRWSGSSWIVKLAKKYNGATWVDSLFAEDIPGVSYVSYPRNYTDITQFDGTASTNDIIEFRIDANTQNFENDILDGGNWNGN